jgi:pathogenesis-related protein 1
MSTMLRTFVLALLSIAACGNRGTLEGPRVAEPIGDRDDPGGDEPGPHDGVTEAHNRVRAAVGVPALAWSDRLARVAQQWADHLAKRGCDLQHRSDGRYGENLYWSSAQASGPEAVSAWADEKRYYRSRSGRCSGGECGHYTQIVWRGTQRVGCGSASCRGGGEVWVCNYDPPGNFVGEKAY